MKGQTNPNILGAQLQRRLRNQLTDAERVLWRHLRGRQLADFKFRRQHPYCDYILDFVCLERKLVVELDGSQHLDNAAYDAKRDAYLEQAGFVVLRFWDNQVLQETESVLAAIWQALHAIPHPPAVSPRPGEEARTLR